MNKNMDYEDFNYCNRCGEMLSDCCCEDERECPECGKEGEGHEWFCSMTCDPYHLYLQDGHG